MRRFLVAGNWKMHGSSHMTAELINGVAQIIGENLPYDVLVCPSAPYLAAAVAANQPHIAVGAQNVSQFEQGAYTGEISLPMLQDLGAKYVLLGHSERRELYAEDDDLIANKFAACVNTDIKPVLCIGETLEQRESGNTEAVVEKQLNAVLEKVGIKGFANAVIAYEPVWAIGTGMTATPAQAQEVHAFIRGLLNQLDVNIADTTQILYGGSVKPTNAKELFAQADIDGGLIGGASLNIESFAGICQAAQKLAAD